MSKNQQAHATPESSSPRQSKVCLHRLSNRPATNASIMDTCTDALGAAPPENDSVHTDMTTARQERSTRRPYTRGSTDPLVLPFARLVCVSSEAARNTTCLLLVRCPWRPPWDLEIKPPRKAAVAKAVAIPGLQSARHATVRRARGRNGKQRGVSHYRAECSARSPWSGRHVPARAAAMDDRILAEPSQEVRDAALQLTAFRRFASPRSLLRLCEFSSFVSLRTLTLRCTPRL